MAHHKILVIGSSNTDMVITASRFPAPGETLLGGSFLMNPGGKGANQAVAAARLGGNVTFLGKVGDDLFGRQTIEQLKEEGINTDYLFVTEESPSGVALITVNSKGENTIVVASGANGALSPDDVNQAQPEIDQAELLLIQLEIPIETVHTVVEMAAIRGKKVILNPAPAIPLPDELLSKLYIITPNETETEILTGIRVTDEQSALQAASLLHQKGVEIVIVTMGAAGVFLLESENHEMIEPPNVQAIDTTAAGDTFNGALAVALTEGNTIRDSVIFACRAASVSVTRPGAQASMPYRKELAT